MILFLSIIHEANWETVVIESSVSLIWVSSIHSVARVHWMVKMLWHLFWTELCRGHEEGAKEYWKKMERCVVEKDGKFLLSLSPMPVGAHSAWKGTPWIKRRIADQLPKACKQVHYMSWCVIHWKFIRDRRLNCKHLVDTLPEINKLKCMATSAQTSCFACMIKMIIHHEGM